jgi:hypothetical protein
MKTRKNLFIMISVVFLFLLGLSCFGASTLFAANPNMVRPGEFVIEPPTLISLGFEWYVQGDDNHDATVEVWYRKEGDTVWKEALPLLRIYHEEHIRVSAIGGDLHYVAPNMFAGSIFDLEPDTEYECKFLMSDPDGVRGVAGVRAAHKILTVRTRAEPKPFAGGKVYHVYPPGYTGPKLEPAFTGLMWAYYTGYCNADWSMAMPPRVQPGDTILVHAGLYKDVRLRYGAEQAGLGGLGLGTPFDGTYYLTQSGTPEKPIAIKAAGDGEAIFDGDGCFNLFNVMAANYNYFEGLTIRNTDIAFWAGAKSITGSSGLTIKKCRFENIGAAVFTDYSGSKNFYIADNVLLGRHNPNYLMGWTGALWNQFPEYPALLTSYNGIKVYGSGHVVCHNSVKYFHDGICHATYGLPDGHPGPDGSYQAIRDRMPVSIDFYNNDISHCADNCIEADGAMHNIRVLRNRCTNSASQGLSIQPIFAGPSYFIRNIEYHVPGGSFKSAHGQGGYILHNTLCGEAAPGVLSNQHFLNNLILKEGTGSYIFSINTFTNYTSSDYNGFFPNAGAAYSFRWTSPPFDIMADYVNPGVVRNFKTLAEFTQGTGQDEHSILVDYNIFYNLSQADPSDPRRVYDPNTLDFRLKPNAVAVDAGCILPNVNDDFTGQAPDLGALEVGRPVPIYGPRP